MAHNSRMTVAAHILSMLAQRNDEEPCGCALTSDALALSIGTHPVVVRRALAQLKTAGLVVSKRGAGGGSALARPPADITLRDVWEAVEHDGDVIGRHPGGPSPSCPLGNTIAAVLDDVYGDAEEALKRHLDAVTLEDMRDAIAQRLTPPT